ncbi:MAG: hypothetical protein EXS58_14290 [Candidatus Latescibacteria bacterium]|nr:hypothetical protein [Candidatus Latescibacterota bacterium]
MPNWSALRRTDALTSRPSPGCGAKPTASTPPFSRPTAPSAGKWTSSTGSGPNWQQAKGEVAQPQAATSAAQAAGRQALLAVHVFPAGEQFLREQGYLETGRKMFRKSYKLIKALDPADPHLRQAAIGQPIELEGDLKALADHYGRLREGKDYQQEKLEGRIRVTFTNPLLQGTEVAAVMGE